jgi:hypothetical protein
MAGLAGDDPVPLEGQLLAIRGRVLAGRGEPESGRLRLEEALTILRRLGARADVVETERLVAALG